MSEQMRTVWVVYTSPPHQNVAQAVFDTEARAIHWQNGSGHGNPQPPAQEPIKGKKHEPDGWRL